MIPATTEVGTAFTVVATGSRTGYNNLAVSSSFQTVVGEVSGGSVTVSAEGGGVWAGTRISASVGGYSPAGGSVVWAWYEYKDGAGVGSVLSDEASFDIPETARFGDQYLCVATVSVPGYGPPALPPVASVATGSLGGGSVKVDGARWPGTVLTAAVADFSPAATGATYTWYEGVGTGGTELGTGATYLIDSWRPVGWRVTVEAVATRAGYEPVAKQETVTVAEGSIGGGTLNVTGSSWAGQTMSAEASGFSPPADSVTYQWYVGGDAEGEKFGPAGASLVIPAKAPEGQQYTV
ncbi:MAG: hypothetical protein LBK59_02135, partial [Bifidobacteriaceae bacterium]|nr:hypothetical protein [Bifidobacteriaceae bacterium]